MTMRNFQFLLERWNHFWFRPVPPHALGLFRVIFGSFLLILTVRHVPSVVVQYSSEGVYLPFAFPPDGSAQGVRDLLGFLLQPVPPLGAWVVYAAFLFSILCFTVGFQTRIATISTFLFYAYYYFLFSHLVDGSFDHIYPLVLLVLVFSGAGRAYSADSIRKEKRLVSKQWVSIFPQRVICLQLSIAYLSIGLVRILKGGWESGVVLEQSLTTIWATPAAYTFLDLAHFLSIGGNPWLLGLTVFLVKAIEILLPFTLWFRNLWIPSVIVGVLFHIGISLMLTMWPFLGMVAVYFLYLSPEVVAEWVRRLRFFEALHEWSKM